MRRLARLARLVVVGLLVGLGGGFCVGRLVGLLHRLTRLTEKGLVGVVALSGSCVRNELALVLLPLIHDNRGHDTAHDDHGEHADKYPDPYGNGAALPFGVLRAAGRCAGGLPLDLMGIHVVESDLVAVNLTAVGLGDLAGESDGLGKLHLIGLW